jgi:hypothetical protein
MIFSKYKSVEEKQQLTEVIMEELGKEIAS